MRKVLSFVLVLALVLSSFSMAFAAEATPVKAPAPAPANTVLTDIQGLACEEAVKVLVDLAIINGYGDGTYKPAGTLTRAEAAVVVIKALGLEKSVGTQKSAYKDMAGYGWAEGYIAFATNLGILTGYGDGTFKPGNPVSYNELAAMLVRSLGYTPASLPGAWPANYVNKAAGLGIMDGIVSGGNNGANRGDVAVMTANNLGNQIGTINTDNQFQPTLIKGSEAKGTAVYDCYVQRLGGTQYTDVIAEQDSVININPYMGKYCAYYENKDGEVIAVKEVKSVTLDGKWNQADAVFTADDVDYKLPTVYTYKDSKDDTQSAERIANGEVGTATNTAFSANGEYTLEVKTSGKSVKEVYSVGAWTANAANKVVAGDLDDLKNASLLGYDFDTNKDDSINTMNFTLVGAASLDKIKAGDVIYVYADKDSVIKKVAVGTEVVEGKVTKVNSTFDTWTVNKTAYDFSEAPGAASPVDKLDNDVKLYLDAYGNIYKYDVTSGSADNYAILKATGSFDSVKLYLADDTTKVYDTDLDDAVSTTAVAGDIVAYSINKSGVVDVLENSTSTAITSGALVSNKVFTVSAGATYTVDSNVVVFTKDGSDNYGIAKIADIEKDTYASFVLYLDGKNVMAMVAPEGLASGSTTDSYAVISKAESSLNPAGDKGHVLTGFIDGKKMNAVYTASTSVAPDKTKIEAGPAVYKIKYNDDKNISKLTAVLAAQQATGFTVSGGGAQYAADGYIVIANASGSSVVATTAAISDKAVVYTVSYDGSKVDSYASFSGSIKENSQVWLYNFDGDDSVYDVVIVKK